jgi:hypothetical protein
MTRRERDPGCSSTGVSCAPALATASQKRQPVQIFGVTSAGEADLNDGKRKNFRKREFIDGTALIV